MVIIKICKTDEEYIDFYRKYNIVDELISDDGNITVAGYEHGIEINQNDQGGFCVHCKEYKEKFLSAHANIYCRLNFNKDEEYVKAYKMSEKTRQARRVICCCGKNVGYSSLSKHRLTKLHTNKVGYENKFCEIKKT